IRNVALVRGAHRARSRTRRRVDPRGLRSGAARVSRARLHALASLARGAARAQVRLRQLAVAVPTLLRREGGRDRPARRARAALRTPAAPKLRRLRAALQCLLSRGQGCTLEEAARRLLPGAD